MYAKVQDTKVLRRCQEHLQLSEPGTAHTVMALAKNQNRHLLSTSKTNTVKSKLGHNGSVMHYKHTFDKHDIRTIVETMADIDYKDHGDFMDIKLGGDGDNGEHLIDLMIESLIKLGYNVSEVD